MKGRARGMRTLVRRGNRLEYTAYLAAHAFDPAPYLLRAAPGPGARVLSLLRAYAHALDCRLSGFFALVYGHVSRVLGLVSRGPARVLRGIPRLVRYVSG